MSQKSSTMLSRVHVRLTRNGYHFAFVALFTIVGAVARNLNLLAVMAGLLLATLLVQWRFARGELLYLSVQRSLPSEAFAGSVFAIGYRIVNMRRLLPTWSLQIDQPLHCESNRREHAQGHTTIAEIPCGATVSGSVLCCITRRGKYRVGTSRVFTEFPFGLLRAYRYHDQRDHLVVYPQLGTLRHGWRAWLMSQQPGLVVSRRRAGVAEGDFYGLRAWQNGDSRRWIHWRTTARIGELAVRQFEQHQRQQLGILVDLHRASDVPEESFERLISFVATLVNELLRNPENQLSFAMTHHEALSNLSLKGYEFRRHVLERLALAQSTSEDENMPGALARLLESSDASWPMLVASTRPVDPLALRGTGGSGARLASLDLRWVNMNDPQSQSLFRDGTNDE